MCELACCSQVSLCFDGLAVSRGVSSAAPLEPPETSAWVAFLSDMLSLVALSLTDPTAGWLSGGDMLAAVCARYFRSPTTLICTLATPPGTYANGISSFTTVCPAQTFRISVQTAIINIILMKRHDLSFLEASQNRSHSHFKVAAKL